MANFYAETIKREPNHRGQPRLVSALAERPDARHHGFDGDGTAPKRGEEAGRHRFWEFPGELTRPLPDGVEQLTAAAFDKSIEEREAAKPLDIPVTTEDTEGIFAGLTTAGKLAMLGKKVWGWWGR